MSEEKIEITENGAKKRNIAEIALPFQKIGAMDALPATLALIPFALWTAFRYYKGGFPIGQIGLYLLFLVAVVIGSRFLFSFYAFYDKDSKKVGIAQYLVGIVKDDVSADKITAVKVHTVEIKEKKISVDILPRFARGVYKVYRLERDGVQVPELGKDKYDISPTIWLYRKDDIEKFESLLREALSEANNPVEIERFDDVIDWKDYKKMFGATETPEEAKGE